VLVDTSVWVEHLRRGLPRLAAALEQQRVETHPSVLGELALGRIRRRAEILSLLDALPRVPAASHDEALALIEARGLAGSGIGWVDAHLLASTLVARTTLWTLDRRLAAVAAQLGIAALG
jgi:hypothetical protein